MEPRGGGGGQLRLPRPSSSRQGGQGHACLPVYYYCIVICVPEQTTGSRHHCRDEFQSLPGQWVCLSPQGFGSCDTTAQAARPMHKYAWRWVPSWMGGTPPCAPPNPLGGGARGGGGGLARAHVCACTLPMKQLVCQVLVGGTIRRWTEVGTLH